MQSQNDTPPKIPQHSPQLDLVQLGAVLGQAIASALESRLGCAGGLALAPLPRLPLREALTEFLNLKARAQRSDAHLKHLLASCKAFSKANSRITADQVSAQAIEAWLADGEWSPNTQKHYLADLSIFFNWCVNRGYMERNPAKAVEVPYVDKSKPVHIHTPDQVKQVLETAAQANQDVCRHLAIRYFAGVRTSEAFRMREAHLKLEQDLIEVPAQNAKTRRRRLITIHPNLRAWLDLGGELRPLGAMTVRDVIRLSGVPWLPNVTRHSFVSYHLAKHESAAKTALQAGNSEQMVFAHYRALVTPAAGAEYWSIRPK